MEREAVDLNILAPCAVNEFYCSLVCCVSTVGHQSYHPDLVGAGSPWGRNGWGLGAWASLSTLKMGVRRTTVVGPPWKGWSVDGV